MTDIEADPFILDIDLDVFHSSRVARPDDSTTFYRLIRNAVAITIAKEPECVRAEWHDEALALSADELLAIILGHIEAALEAESA